MTSPAVDVPRDIPLKMVETFCSDNDNSDDETGFPFDRNGRDNQGRFRSRLDDFAQHIPPEFADYFPNDFPFAAGGSGGSRARTHTPQFRRFAQDFPAEFEDFGFPARDQQQRFHPQQQQQPAQDFPHQQYYQEPAQEYYQPPPQPQQQQPEAQQQQQQQPQEPQQQQQQQQQTAQPEGESGEKKNNLQQSNTVDLGQQQEPVEDRKQRSMSAPPDNRPRFTSSINIPMNSHAANSNMDNGPQAQPEQQQQHAGGKPVERVIPIVVEGRDGAFVPRNTPPQHHHQQQQHYQQPEPEPMYTRDPEYFRNFMNPDPRQRFFDEDPFRRTRSAFQQRTPNFGMPPQQRQHQPQQQQQPQRQQTPPPSAPKPQQQQPKPQQQQPQQPQPQQQEPQKQATPPPAAPPKPPTPLELIETVHKEATTLMAEVEKFAGKSKDKQYLYLDEMFTRLMIKLDNIDTQGQDNIRTARKEAVRFVQKCINELERKATGQTETTTTTMEVDKQSEAPAADEQKPAEPMEVTTEPVEETRAVLVVDESAKEADEKKADETNVETTQQTAETDNQAKEEDKTESKKQKKAEQ